MSLEAFVSIVHVGGSGQWSFCCRPGDDNITWQHPVRPGSHIQLVHCLLHMKRGGKKGSTKQSSSPLCTVGIFCAVTNMKAKPKKAGLKSFLLECQGYVSQGKLQPT